MQASQDDIDLSGAFAALKRGLPKLIGLTLLAGALTYGVLLLVPATYKSTAQIILESSSSSLLRPSGEAVSGGDLKIDENEVASQAEVIRSRDLLSKVAATDHLDQTADFNLTLRSQSLVGRILGLFTSAPGGADPAERALNLLEQNIRVGEVPKTRLINVDVTAHDANLAANIANHIAESYLDRNRANQVKDASDATTSIGSSLTEVKKEAEAAEADLERFRAESGLLSGQNNVTLNSQQLSELNTQLTQATAARTEADARSHILKDMIASGHVENSQEVVKSPNMQQLFQQKLRVERDIAELSATLLPAHPRMRQLDAELAIANDRLREEAKQVAVGVEDDLKVAKAREQALQDSLSRLTEAAAKSSDAQAKLSSLEREAQSKRNSYDALLQRLNEASSRRNNSSVSAMARLNERAVPASIPDSPKKAQMSLFAMLGTLLIGLVGMIGRALLGGGSAGADVKSVGRPAKPPVQGPAPGPVAVRLAQPAALAKFVAGAAKRGTAGRVLLTGEDTHQDLSHIIVELCAGLTAGQPGLVLIDLTEPAVAGKPGLCDLVRGKSDFEAALAVDAAGGWHSIGPGSAPPKSWRALGENLELVLEALAASYPHVLIAAGRAEAADLLEALDGKIGLGIVCAAPGRAAGSPVDEGFLGYDVPGMELAWLEAPRVSKRDGAAKPAVKPLGPVPA